MAVADGRGACTGERIDGEKGREGEDGRRDASERIDGGDAGAMCAMLVARAKGESPTTALWICAWALLAMSGQGA